MGRATPAWWVESGRLIIRACELLMFLLLSGLRSTEARTARLAARSTRTRRRCLITCPKEARKRAFTLPMSVADASLRQSCRDATLAIPVPLAAIRTFKDVRAERLGRSQDRPRHCAKAWSTSRALPACRNPSWGALNQGRDDTPARTTTPAARSIHRDAFGDASVRRRSARWEAGRDEESVLCEGPRSLPQHGRTPQLDEPRALRDAGGRGQEPQARQTRARRAETGHNKLKGGI